MKSVLTGLPLQRPSASNAKITTRGKKKSTATKRVYALHFLKMIFFHNNQLLECYCFHMDCYENNAKHLCIYLK